MGEHIDKLTSDNEKLVNVSNELQERNDKQDSELRNLKKERPTSEAGRTNVLYYAERHNTALNKCMTNCT